MIDRLPYTYPPFIRKWFEWMEYRKEIKKPYKSQKSIDRQLKWFVSNGFDAEQAIEMIDTSIRNGWQGIFPIKTFNNGGQQTSKTGTSSTRIDALKKW